MKQFILKLTLLVLPFALFLGAYQFQATRVRPNEYAAKRELLRRQAAHTQVLILGSSHSYYDLMPKELGSNVLNLAAVAESVYYDHAMLVKYVDQMPQLKMVILPISYFTLGYQVDDGIEVWRSFDYFYFYGLPHRHWKMTMSPRNFVAYYLYEEQLGGTKKVLLGKIRDGFTDFDEWGGWTNRIYIKTAKPMTLPEAAEEALNRHHHLMHPEHVVENTPLLEDMAKLLQARGIKLVIISTPATSYYRAGMDPVKYQQMLDIIQQTCVAHGATYFNYAADPRMVDADFHDADHLNRDGADKFSRIVKAEVMDPLSAKP